MNERPKKEGLRRRIADLLHELAAISAIVFFFMFVSVVSYSTTGRQDSLTLQTAKEVLSLEDVQASGGGPKGKESPAQKE